MMEKTKALLKNKKARIAIIAAVAAVLAHYGVLPTEEAEGLIRAILSIVEVSI